MFAPEGKESVPVNQLRKRILAPRSKESVPVNQLRKRILAPRSKELVPVTQVREVVLAPGGKELVLVKQLREGILTVGCGSTADKRMKVDCSIECTSKLIYMKDMCQHGTLVHTVHCELYLHVTLGHMIPLLVEYINALHSCLNTTTFFSLSHPPLTRSSHIRQHECTRKCMTRKDTVNVIEDTGKYSAQVLDQWMTMVTDVPGRSRGARLTHLLRYPCWMETSHI
jgi:hypothetical protein